MPKVSVVIPCYNYARYLPAAVKSVIGQTFRDFEIIIVDDGSTDDSLDVANGLAEKYGRDKIRVVSQANSGVAAARNNGVRLSSGEYVLPLDADDRLLPEYLELTAKALDEDVSAGIAYTPILVTSDDWPEPLVWMGDECTRDGMLTSNMICGCSLFRKSLWERVGGYNEHLKGSEDYDLWLSFMELGYGGKMVDKPLYMYTRHDTSRSKANDRRRARLRLAARLRHPALYYPRLAGSFPRLAKSVMLLRILRRNLSVWLLKNHRALYLPLLRLWLIVKRDKGLSQ